MLDKIFRKAGLALQLDTESLLARTDHVFIDKLQERVGSEVEIKELKVNGDRRAGYLYFKAGSRQFSFAHDKVKNELLFSELVKRKWQFVVGWRDV